MSTVAMYELVNVLAEMLKEVSERKARMGSVDLTMETLGSVYIPCTVSCFLITTEHIHTSLTESYH